MNNNNPDKENGKKNFVALPISIKVRKRAKNTQWKISKEIDDPNYTNDKFVTKMLDLIEEEYFGG